MPGEGSGEIKEGNVSDSTPMGQQEKTVSTPKGQIASVPYTLKHLFFIFATAIKFVNWIKNTYKNLKGDPFKKIEDFATKVFGPRYTDFVNFLYEFLVSLDKMLDSVLNFAANVWFWFVVVLLLPLTCQFWIIKTGFKLAIQYNVYVLHLQLRGYTLANYIPFIPVKQIGHVLKVSIEAIERFMKFPLEDFSTQVADFEKKQEYENSKKKEPES